jgi:hypothetical protein
MSPDSLLVGPKLVLLLVLSFVPELFPLRFF